MILLYVVSTIIKLVQEHTTYLLDYFYGQVWDIKQMLFRDGTSIHNISSACLDIINQVVVMN